MGASPVVGRTLVDILAGVIIRGQFVAGDIGTVALVAPFEIDATALARPVPVIHQALVNVWTRTTKQSCELLSENLTEGDSLATVVVPPLETVSRGPDCIVNAQQSRHRFITLVSHFAIAVEISKRTKRYFEEMSFFSRFQSMEFQYQQIVKIWIDRTNILIKEGACFRLFVRSEKREEIRTNDCFLFRLKKKYNLENYE